MEKHSFGGPVLFLDRNDINTDEIIPAKYLTEISRAALGPHLLEDLKLPDFDPGVLNEGYGAILTRSNFGCGSSREHAPWALEARGIRVVLAESFARIFRQNMFNCGLLALELSAKDVDMLFKTFHNTPTKLSVNIKDSALTFTGKAGRVDIGLSLSGFDKALVEAGGWVEYADSRY